MLPHRQGERIPVYMSAGVTVTAVLPVEYDCKEPLGFKLKNYSASSNQAALNAEVSLSTNQADTLIMFLEKDGGIEN